ncbi:uncharacterized protein [Physcomitrium patens]|uniref:Small ribosomal subunit protein uS10c n=1 Tax=Physcomitrium patens TaxID=3218 RepID=A0A2K1IHE5_PHYPA|nr:hypothetical protein PHYPA_029273 [Physcomitrium patens]
MKTSSRFGWPSISLANLQNSFSIPHRSRPSIRFSSSIRPAAEAVAMASTATFAAAAVALPSAAASAISSSRVAVSRASPSVAHLSTFEGLRADGVVRRSNAVWQTASQTSSTPNYPRLSVKAAAATEAPLTATKQKIRIKLRSYWVNLIEQACQQILEAARNSDAKTMGPVPLPTKKRVYCVLRSPHVNKDSREHFEIRTHRRLIDLENPNAQTIDALMQLDLPAGVDVEVKLS